MATITVTISAMSSSKTISAGDLTRLLDAARAKFGKITENGVPRDRTNAEVFDLIVGDFTSYLRRLVADADERVAVAAITPITLT